MSPKRMKLPDATKVSYATRPVVDYGPWPGPIVGPIRPPIPVGDPFVWQNIRDLLDKRQLIAVTKLEIDHLVNTKKLELLAIRNDMLHLAKIKKVLGR